MLLLDLDEDAWCKIFPTTLRLDGQKWSHNISPGSINYFDELHDAFINRYSMSKKQPKIDVVLAGLKQGSQETLRQYLTRFNDFKLGIPDLEDSVALFAFRNGCTNEEFQQSIQKKKLTSLEDLMTRAEAFINIEEDRLLRAGRFTNSRTQSTNREGETQRGHKLQDRLFYPMPVRQDERPRWNPRARFN